jgi:serine/threonine protein kinase
MPTTDQEAFASADGGTEETLNPTLLSAPPLLGATLNERYLIEREIKRGGFGVVYLAHDKQLHSRPVVVKVLLEEALQNEWIVGKFRQEIEALSRIDHPGIVGIIDAGELPDGKPYLVMEYVDGSTLRSVMIPEGVSFERAAALLKQIGRALAAAHDKGILHRDLKPENVMLRDLGHGEEQVKIIDFGIAKVRNSVLAPTTVMTNIAGTISYMAPEQLSARPVSAATDSYALGSMAYEMLTGRRPFNPETSFQLLELQRAGVRVKPIDLRPGLPKEAEEVILKALSFEPRDRYQSTRELGDALALALTGEVPTLELRRKSTAEISPTQLSTETIPNAARTADEASAKTLAASFEPAQVITPPSDMAASMPAPPSRFSIWLNTPWLKFAVSFVFLVAVVTAFYGVFTLRSASVPNATNNTSSNRSAAPATYATAERSLAYSLTVQKFHDGKSYDQPFQTSGQEIFENGWKFKMNILSSQDGYLYLLNEGPGANGGTTYNVLFPEPKTNGGSPRVTTDQKLQTAWMKFDEHQGTEKFWIVWAASPVKELDDVTGVVNAQQKGEISDAAQAKAVRDFLEKHSSPKPEVAKDSAGEKTTVKGKGDLLVSNVGLKHH